MKLVVIRKLGVQSGAREIGTEIGGYRVEGRGENLEERRGENRGEERMNLEERPGPGGET